MQSQFGLCVHWPRSKYRQLSPCDSDSAHLGALSVVGWATLKRNLFSVQRMAIIVASQELQNLFIFSIFFFPLYRNYVEKLVKKKNVENVKNKCTNWPLKSSSGLWTGNRIIFKGGLGKPGGSKDIMIREFPGHSTFMNNVYTI